MITIHFWDVFSFLLKFYDVDLTKCFLLVVYLIRCRRDDLQDHYDRLVWKCDDFHFNYKRIEVTNSNDNDNEFVPNTDRHTCTIRLKNLPS